MSISIVVRQLFSNPINMRNGRLAALARFLRYQAAVRLMPSGVLLPFVDGSVLLAQRGGSGVTGNWYGGLHEVNEMAFVLHALRPGETFVDVGANAGSYTILAARGVGARVVAVEPVPETFTRLRRNVDINLVGDRVTCFAGGLSDAAGTIRFTADKDTMNRVWGSEDTGSSVDVRVVTLDELVGDLAPAVIKIDVEGHELAVVRGGARTLAAATLRAVLMETNGSGARYGVNDGALVEAMAGHGFRPCEYDAFGRRLHPAGGANNTIFVRNPGEVEAICDAAPVHELCNGKI